MSTGKKIRHMEQKRKRQTNHTIDSGQLSIAGNPG